MGDSFVYVCTYSLVFCTEGAVRKQKNQCRRPRVTERKVTCRETRGPSDSTKQPPHPPIHDLADSAGLLTTLTTHAPTHLPTHDLAVLLVQLTKVKNVKFVELGRYRMETWYYSPFPKVNQSVNRSVGGSRTHALTHAVSRLPARPLIE